MLLSKLTSALALAGILSACETAPPGDPGSGNPSFGALASQNMADYYYPNEAGWTYTYSNTLTVDGQSTVGSEEVLHTLGQLGTAPNGEPIYGAVISYKVDAQYVGRQAMNIYYEPVGANGRIIEGENQVGNSVAFAKPKPKPVSTDTILACLAGPIKKRIDPAFTGGTGVLQHDTLWYTAYRDSVILWERNLVNGSLQRARQIFLWDLTKKTNAWQYGLWEASTYWEAAVDDIMVGTPAGSFRSAQINCFTDEKRSGTNVRLPITETKWFGYTRGLVRQVDSWTSTIDGTNQSKIQNSLTRELKSAAKD